MPKITIDVDYDRDKLNDTAYFNLLTEHLKTKIENELLKAMNETLPVGEFRTFESLIDIDKDAWAYVLRNVSKDDLVNALKGSSQALCTYVYGFMSERAANIVREDMYNALMVRVRDVDLAQKKIVNLVNEYYTMETKKI